MTPAPLPRAVLGPRVGWSSDLHLPHASPAAYAALLDEVAMSEAPTLVVTGDVSTGSLLLQDLTRLDRDLAPSCLTLVIGLGNHDFYGQPRGELLFQLQGWALSPARRRRIVLLSRLTEPLWLTPTVALVGHDGWYDLRAGVGPGTPWRIADLAHILEYGSEPGAVPSFARRWAAEATDHIVALATQAVAAGAERLVVATHVPPWVEAALHQGRPSDPEAAPWFVQTDLGDALQAWQTVHPAVDVLVLCGHTHGRARVEIQPGLTCWASGVDYGRPRLEAVFRVDGASGSGWHEREPSIFVDLAHPA